jgi:hypothetical protein
MFSEIFWHQQAALPCWLILQLLPLFGAAVVFALGERSTAVAAGKLFALAELLLQCRRQPMSIPCSRFSSWPSGFSAWLPCCGRRYQRPVFAADGTAHPADDACTG